MTARSRPLTVHRIPNKLNVVSQCVAKACEGSRKQVKPEVTKSCGGIGDCAARLLEEWRASTRVYGAAQHPLVNLSAMESNAKQCLHRHSQCKSGPAANFYT